jgi:hypothetical protein
MTPEQKWLLIFGRDWVCWDEICESNYVYIADSLHESGQLEVNISRYQVRLIQNETVRVRLAEATWLHPV